MTEIEITRIEKDDLEYTKFSDLLKMWEEAIHSDYLLGIEVDYEDCNFIDVNWDTGFLYTPMDGYETKITFDYQNWENK